MRATERSAAWLQTVGLDSATGRDVLAVDWAASPLGDPAGWPVELRVLVQLCLTTRFPMLVTWGPDLTMIYNDGYRDIIGDKHPGALGAPMAVVLGEAWHELGPLADHVLRTGQPTWAEHQRLFMTRAGFVEETYFTFSYSPANNAQGVAAGIVDVATETTGQVLAQRRLTALSALAAATATAAQVTDVCVAAAAELATWTADIVDADIFLDVNDTLILIASTRKAEPTSLDYAVLESALSMRAPRVVRSSSEDAPTLDPPDGVALPLLQTGGGPGGVLYIEPSHALPYSAEHGAFLTAVATTLGIALDAANARATELGEQRRINETLQQAMLQPANDHPTVAARYRPAALNLAVGGDWYDVIDLDEHRRALVVGDCVGHGLEAATAMGQLRSAIRALLLEGHDPATALEQLDTFSTSIPEAFGATVVVAVIDRLAATVTYSRAGHVPPLLIDNDSSRWLDGACGSPIGILPDVHRPTATLDYVAGGLLVLYTDGLIERRGELIDQGLARLDAATRHWYDRTGDVHQLVDSVLRDLLSTRRDDDVVLVAKRLVIDHPA